MSLTPESFKLLLDWLDPDPDRSALEYERIRSLLIRKFTSHGCPVSDKLADRTFDRVASLLPQIIERYKGARDPYFKRVGYYILLEWLKEQKEEELTSEMDVPQPAVESEDDDDFKPLLPHLTPCLEKLPQENRILIVRYYAVDGPGRIKVRQDLARSLKIELRVLRVRVLRIKTKLQKCIDAGVKRDRRRSRKR